MKKIGGSQPLHLQVASYIREKIYNHEWRVNGQIPTEFELCESLSVSRGTVKRAIRPLVEEGLLSQIRGRGTFVTGQHITHPTGSCLLSFAESLRSQGIDFQTKVLRKEVVQADDFISQRLSINPGDDVLMLDRVRLVEDEPIIYFESAINLALVPGLELIDLEAEPLFATIEQNYGLRIGHSSAQYAARVAGSERGAILRIDPESPVLHLEQQIFLADNRSIEWSNVWLRANKYVVGTVMQRV